MASSVIAAVTRLGATRISHLGWRFSSRIRVDSDRRRLTSAMSGVYLSVEGIAEHQRRTDSCHSPATIAIHVQQENHL